MIIRIGNFFFHYRNGLFPVFYALLFIRSVPLAPNFRTAAVIGLAVGLVGQLFRAVTIGLEYIVRGGRNRQVYADGLVTGGMFSHCRNPLYVGNFLMLVGLGIASNSTFFLAVVIPSFAFIYWTIIAAEENYLRQKFGADFQNYCSRVNRLLPNFRGFKNTIQGTQFNWRRLITAEYGSTYIWVTGMLAVTLRNALSEPGANSREGIVPWLWAGLLAAGLCYLTARILKKTGRLNSPTPSKEKEPAKPAPIVLRDSTNR
jgi:protein-S-isoprenylcysteine O-methyltransferase Ste14